MSKNVGLIADRLRSWQTGDDPSLDSPLDLINRVGKLVEQLDQEVHGLQISGYVPTKRSSAVIIEPSNHVAVKEDYRSSYELAFEKVLQQDPDLLNDLVVKKILPSGEVVVQRGTRTPFMARKSHLRRI
jgi:hypothetical protein